MILFVRCYFRSPTLCELAADVDDDTSKELFRGMAKITSSESSKRVSSEKDGMQGNRLSIKLMLTS